MTEAPGPAASKGGEGLGISQQENLTGSRNRGFQHPPGGTWPPQQPGSLRALPDPYPTGQEGWRWATLHGEVQAKASFHAPTQTTEALTGLKACGFCLGFTEGKQLPKKHC